MLTVNLKIRHSNRLHIEAMARYRSNAPFKGHEQVIVANRDITRAMHFRVHVTTSCDSPYERPQDGVTLRNLQLTYNLACLHLYFRTDVG